jgi:hypothetical protein
MELELILQEPVMQLCSGCWSGAGWRFSFNIPSDALPLVRFESDHSFCVVVIKRSSRPS